jgi:hypothetical protein
VSRWDEQVAAFASTADLLALLERPDDPRLTAEAQKLFFLTLASGWFSAFADPDFPDFVPAVNTHLNCVGTNPDFVYGAASIDGLYCKW